MVTPYGYTYVSLIGCAFAVGDVFFLEIPGGPSVTTVGTYDRYHYFFIPIKNGINLVICNDFLHPALDKAQLMIKSTEIIKNYDFLFAAASGCIKIF